MKRFLASLIAACLLLVACGGSDAPLKSAQAQAPLPPALCDSTGEPLPAAPGQARAPLATPVGDSLTAYMPGAGARNRLAPERTYTKELRASFCVVTSSVGGATTEVALANQGYWLEKMRPAVLPILLGTNDAVYAMDRAKSLGNIEALALKWPAAKVILISPPHWRDYADPWMAAWALDLRDLAARRGWEFVDGYALSLAHPEWQCEPEDGHPCESFHRFIGPLVALAAQRALSKP